VREEGRRQEGKKTGSREGKKTRGREVSKTRNKARRQEVKKEKKKTTRFSVLAGRCHHAGLAPWGND